MTLIDKAEAHDDDLIRRGDALAAAAGIYRWSVAAGEELEAAIAALPPAKQDNVAISNARGVGVPTEADREWIDARADELFREAERRRGAVTVNTTRQQDFRDYFVVNATLERFAALNVTDMTETAPTDAAQVRGVVLHIENAKRLCRYDWQEWTAQDIEDAEGIICDYLALIGDNKHD